MPLVHPKRSEVIRHPRDGWGVRWYDLDGRRHVTHRRIRSRADADRFARAKDDELLARFEGVAPDPEIATLRQLFDECLEKIWAEKWKFSTKRAEEVRMDFICLGLGDARLRDLGAARIEQWLAAQRERGCGPATVNRYRARLHAAFALAVKWSDRTGVARNPVSSTFRRREEPRERRCYGPDEIARLKAACPPDLALGIEVALRTLLRLGEMLNTEWRDWDLAARRVRVTAGGAKNRTERVIPISESLAALMRRWRIKSKSRPFERSVHGWEIAWRKAWRKAGVEGDWHSLRHTGATWLAQRGASVRLVQQVGGWKTLQLVMRYVHEDVDAAAHDLDEMGW